MTALYWSNIAKINKEYVSWLQLVKLICQIRTNTSRLSQFASGHRHMYSAYTHAYTTCRNACCLHVHVCVCVCACVSTSRVCVFSPAGSVFKCQTFNLLNLTWSGMSVADYHVQETRYRQEKNKTQKKDKMPTLAPSICWRTDWSVMRREERICSRTGGEQKGKAEGRTGWREGGEEGEEEGSYSHYIMNEVRSHIFAVEALFILFSGWTRHLYAHKLTSYYTCGGHCWPIITLTYS